MVAGEYVKDRPVLAAGVTLCAALVVANYGLNRYAAYLDRQKIAKDNVTCVAE